MGHLEIANTVVESEVAVKPCPYCGKSLKAGVVVCRYCQRDLFNPDAPPIVGLHDWERPKPPEKVVYTVRLPVSELQWAMTCYALTAAVGAFWIASLLRPAPVSFHEPIPRQNRSMGASASHESLTSFVAIPPTAVKNSRETPTPEKGELVPAASPTPEVVSSPDSSSAVERSVATGSGLSAPELVMAYNTEMGRAEDRYTHHPITVTGRVLAVGKGADKTPFVLLQGIDSTQVKCLFPPQKGKNIPPLAVGSEVKISGTCEGRFVDVTLSDCRLEF